MLAYILTFVLVSTVHCVYLCFITIVVVVYYANKAAYEL